MRRALEGRSAVQFPVCPLVFVVHEVPHGACKLQSVVRRPLQLLEEHFLQVVRLSLLQKLKQLRPSVVKHLVLLDARAKLKPVLAEGAFLSAQLTHVAAMLSMIAITIKSTRDNATQLIRNNPGLTCSK